MRMESFMPSEALIGKPRIVLSGQESLLIEQHRGIVSYTPDRLVVRMNEGRMNILGSEMKLQSYEKRELWVLGTIKSLEFVL